MTTQIVTLESEAKADGKINWVTATAMVLFHIGAVAALFFFTWKAFFLALFLWWVSGSLGIGMGYHRLLTHRGYKTPKWVEYFLTVCATSPITSSARPAMRFSSAARSISNDPAGQQ